MQFELPLSSGRLTTIVLALGCLINHLSSCRKCSV